MAGTQSYYDGRTMLHISDGSLGGNLGVRNPEWKNFGPLPDFPQRLRAAGIDEEDFKMVLQTCKDNERAKQNCIAIAFPGFCGPQALLVLPCVIYYTSKVRNSEAGVWLFNSKYGEKNIKCSRVDAS